ncbi:MAG TPA: DUF1015 domain-containing protein [Phycisphaerales bacterium]|nr:DUF1015 domain-containing protein [Phycisphaerales bacterium]
MPKVYPFRAVQYGGGRGDVSARVAPPYDVLDAEDKRALLSRDPCNIVAIDLPHVPPKELGPREAYAGAAALYTAWLAEGVLTHRAAPAMFAYRQTFQFAGGAHQRSGMACAVETAPFGPRPGGGILPHEQTFSGPKEDRFALMRATQAQLSPIFGLHADDSGRATELVRGLMASRAPDMTATTRDGVRHEVWTVEDAASIRAYQDALAGEDVFIADGHHRYNTALNYLAALEKEGAVAAEHPARRCMMVLVGMSDPGLVIGPTHRVLGGMAHYTIDRFIEAATHDLTIREVTANPAAIENAMAHAAAGAGHNVLGLIDFASGRCFVASPKQPDPLKSNFADRVEAWRTLDVSVIQHLIVERICQPKLNDDRPVRWAFPHSVEEAVEIGSGQETGAGGGAGFAQLAVIVRPTPLQAVRDISRAGELMPQKSTYFYPKLATGLFVNPLA